MAPAKSKNKQEPTELMVVNDALDEECRIAVIQDNRLEELYTERTATATNVGNIYKGRVNNVEPAIQAAFIDFGEGQNGFLHISDLHPRYFPGSERKERVGKKIPRHERPPIQHALKRGDEVIVQVLKEGLGTKGPTLTSYLSIPGRLLVAMPQMDRVGVSRKIEDEEQRRKMRQVLDSVDLPKGFGFILRTAGFGRTKTEIKRDVAYLMRLWKLMDQRQKSVKGPCELYTESDLLIRTIRDVLSPTIKAIIVDTESAYHRARNFLQVAAPRSAPKLVLYKKHTPIFHVFDVERQIELIHSHEVPLPSGGRLVIDQTEALVAIDVNSGKSRSAKDSETNAYQTNCEAVDEICRQLRLRDLGGLIINDLIDMRSRKNRRLIEERFNEKLKTDRAKSTVLRISDFGLVEMTRQRMRPSLRKSHFITCSHCHGQGELKSPETVGSDASRQIGFLLQFDRVHRVELVCSLRVASVMLSGKRRELVRMEDQTGKKIDVRVSDAIPSDRVDFYAYDDRNADIDISHLQPQNPPSLKQLEHETAKVEAELTQTRRHGQKSEPVSEEGSEPALSPAHEDGQQPAPSGRRRRRRRRSSQEKTGASAQREPMKPAADDQKKSADEEKQAAAQDGKRSRKKSRQEQTPKGPVRVHVIAKELGVRSREVIERCEKDPNIEVKNHMSTVSPEQVQTIREWFDSDDTFDKTRADQAKQQQQDSRQPQKRKRGRRGRRSGVAGDSTQGSAGEQDSPKRASEGDDASQPKRSEESPRRSRRRRKSRSHGGEARENQPADRSDSGQSSNTSDSSHESAGNGVAMAPASEEDRASSGASRRGRRKRSKRSRTPPEKINGKPMHESNDQQTGNAPEHAQSTGEKPAGSSDDRSQEKKEKPKRRLYRNRSRVSSVAREQAERTSDQ